MRSKGRDQDRGRVRRAQAGYSLLEILIALGAASLITVAGMIMFTGFMRANATQAAVLDAEQEAGFLLARVLKAFEAKSEGSVAPICGVGALGSFSHQLGTCESCSSRKFCRFTRIWLGDDFLSRQYEGILGTKELDSRAANFWNECVDAPAHLAAKTFESVCKSTCAAGKMPVVRYSEDGGVVASFKPKATFPGGTSNAGTRRGQTLAMEMCLSQVASGVIVHIATFHEARGAVQRYVTATVMPVDPAIASNLQRLP